MEIAKFPGYREPYRFIQLLMNLSQLNLVNMGMRWQWSTSFRAQSSQNIKDARWQTHLYTHISQL